MPKRPCAIDILPDDQTVIVGDKFGDVYSLPLLSKEKRSYHETAKTEKKSERKYAPIATEKTVHSKANLKALEEQRKQAEKGTIVKAKEALEFDHDLLLGHVSMLTDLIAATCTTEGGVPRTFIITADRDEHIRVSRGPPQSYVTEGYCLDHSQFVSKLCCPMPTMSTVLVSASSDQELRFWDWSEQKCIKNMSMTEHVRGDKAGFDVGSTRREAGGGKLVVSGLWAVSKPKVDVGFKLLQTRSSANASQYVLLVAFEGIPVLFLIVVDDSYKASRASVSNGTEDEMVRRWEMMGNVLDVAAFGDYIIVSVDNIHKLNSVTDIDESDVSLR